MLYLLFFLILFLAELIYFRIADHFNIIDKPNQRSSHSRVTLRGGGIVFYLGILLYSIWFKSPYPWFFAGLTLIAFISFADDIHSVPNRIRLLFHFSAMLLIFTDWGLFSGLPVWYIAVALILCTGIINAWNFMDGINGITGGYSLGILLCLIWINTRVVSFVDPALLSVALLSVLVFNFFNFRKHAHCFAGDIGAVSIAFIIIFVLGRLMLLTNDLSYIIIVSVYGVDSVLTIVHRLMLHENIFEAHRKHAYQLMANELSIPHVWVSAFYMLVQIFIVAGYLSVPQNMRWAYFIATLFLLGSGYVLFMRKYFHLHLKAGTAELNAKTPRHEVN